MAPRDITSTYRAAGGIITLHAEKRDANFTLSTTGTAPGAQPSIPGGTNLIFAEIY
jgi:hypothetical protein